MSYYVSDKETGTFIEEVKTIEEGKELIVKYEEADKAEGTYEEDFYDIVDEEHCSVLYEVKFLINTTGTEVNPEYITFKNGIEFVTTNENEATKFDTEAEAETAMSQLTDEYECLTVVKVEEIY